MTSTRLLMVIALTVPANALAACPTGSPTAFQTCVNTRLDNLAVRHEADVATLEGRLEDVEVTAADHEDRLAALEAFDVLIEATVSTLDATLAALDAALADEILALADRVASIEADYLTASSLDGYATESWVWAQDFALASEVDGDGDGWTGSEDCDDTDASISPDAFEACDLVDNDCDGLVDEDGGGWFEASSDGSIVDYSAALQESGTAPYELTLSEDGTLHLCEGTYSGSFEVTATVTVFGGGATLTTPWATPALTVGTDGYAVVDQVVFADGRDSGLACTDGGVEVTDSTFARNDAERGAAIYADGGCVVSVTGSTFTGNAASQGGVVYATTDAVVSIDSSLIEDNDASTGGGFAYSDVYAVIAVSNSTVSSNSASRGGAVYVGYSGQLTAETTTFDTNTPEDVYLEFDGTTHDLLSGATVTCGAEGCVYE